MSIPDPEGFLEHVARWVERCGPGERQVLSALAWIDQLAIAQTDRFAPFGYRGVPQGALPYVVWQRDGTPNAKWGADVWVCAIPGAGAWCLFTRCPDSHLRCLAVEPGAPPLSDWDEDEGL